MLECGVTDYSAITTANAYIRHPNYPYDYLPDTDCTYTLRKEQQFTAPIYFLVLKFLTSNYEIIGKLPNCDQDFLEVTVGENSSVKHKFCGNNIPFPIYSTDGVIKFRIFAGPKSDGGSFTAQVVVRSADLGPGCLPHVNRGKTGLVTSPNYPRGYSNVTCDFHLHVGSGNMVDLYFMHMDLVDEPLKGTCSDAQDYVEIKGATKVTTTFLQASRISSRQCGTAVEREGFVRLRYDYVYIRFSSTHITYEQSGLTTEKGVYIGYAIYEAPKKEEEQSHANIVLWVSIICGIILLVVVIWCVIKKALSSKKSEVRVKPTKTPQSVTTEHDKLHTSENHYPPKIRYPVIPSAPEPDYNPSELFAAKSHSINNNEILPNSNLGPVLFPNSDVTMGLNPGYASAPYERTAGHMI